jgi:heptosyltransferase-2
VGEPLPSADSGDRPEARQAPGDLRRILLRLPGWLGDVVMAAPTVAALHRARPEAALTALVRPAFVELAQRLAGVSAVLAAGPDRGPLSLLASRRQIRAGRFDAAVVFPRGARAALAPFLAGVPARVGFAGRGPLLTHGVPGWRPWRRRHRSQWFGLLALPFGAWPAAPERLEPSPESRRAAAQLLRALGRRADRPLVVLEPGASYGPAKCWPPQRFGALASRLLADGADVATVGLPDAAPLERIVAEAAGPGLLRAAGRTPGVGALHALLEAADLVVSNDTGPMHLAAAAGTPVLALFGATDPVVTAPLGPGPRHLIWDPEPCSPCLLRDCVVPGHPCLEKIGVGRVYEAARRLLDRGREATAA